MLRGLVVAGALASAACGGGQKSSTEQEAPATAAPRTLEQRLEALRDDTQRSIAELDAKVEQAALKLNEAVDEESSKDRAAASRAAIADLQAKLDALGAEVEKLTATTQEELDALEKRLEAQLAALTANSKKIEEEAEAGEATEEGAAPPAD